MTSVGATENVGTVGGVTSDSVLIAFTVTVAPLLSTTAIAEPAVHCPVAPTVKRPPLKVTTDGLTVNVPG
ncbi:MAG: hypothetical protein ACXWGU_10825 [Usitatibacter sp.]